MKKIGLFAALALGTAATAWGQSPEELLRFSRTDYSLTTARSAAMGGAFTSLGADPISMSLNPAGLGMYTRNEVTVTGALRITDSKSQYGVQGATTKENYTKPVLNNFSFVYAGQNSNWRVGFGMNRLADFSGKYRVTGDYGVASMAYVLRDQLQGVPSGNLESKRNPFLNYAPMAWNSILGYTTWLLNPYEPNDPKNVDYGVSPSIMPGDELAPQLTTTTNGAVDEFTISTAYNLNGILYFGATVGMQNLFYRQTTQYEEFADLGYNYGSLDSFRLGEDLALDGFGFNIKLGVTVRPVDWLRIGVAYHSPTWIAMRERSFREMDTWFTPASNTMNQSDYTADFAQNYSNQTPSRLMAGLSFTIAKRVIISADYEAAWYNGMRYSTGMNWSSWRSPVAPTDIDNNPNVVNYTNSRNQIDVNGLIADSYRQTNTFRLGIEAQPINGLFFRAGYVYSDSPYAAVKSDYVSGAKLSDYGALTQWSGGLGYRGRSWGVDLAYINSSRKDLPSMFYDHVAAHDYDVQIGDQVTRLVAAGESIIPADKNYVSWVSHNVLLTFSWRF